MLIEAIMEEIKSVVLDKLNINQQIPFHKTNRQWGRKQRFFILNTFLILLAAVDSVFGLENPASSTREN